MKLPEVKLTAKRQRLALVLAALTVLASAIALVLIALENTITYYYNPADLAALKAPPERPIRIGGLVEEGSVEKLDGGLVRFRVTDGTATYAVEYAGLLPDLFREGQGVIAAGRLRADGVFEASQVLAKHDENYMPPEVAEALKKSGRWKHAEETGKAPER